MAQPADAEKSKQGAKEVSEYGLRILGGSGSILSGNMLGKVIAFVLNVVLTRGLGKVLYGLYAQGLTVLRICREVASLGVQNGIVRFGSPQYSGGESSKLKGTFLVGGSIGVICGALIGGVLFTQAPWLARQAFDDSALIPVFKIFAVGLPFYVFTYLGSRMARALGVMRVDALLASILQPGLFLLFAGGLLLGSLGFQAILYAFLASTILAAAGSLYAIYRLIPVIMVEESPSLQVRRLLRFSLPMLGVTLANTGLAYTDRIMIGILASSGAVGVYNAAATMATQMRFALSSINASFSPVISDLYEQGRIDALDELYAHTVRWVLIVTIPVGVILMAFPVPIMSIFGSEYVEGSALLQVLTGAYLIITGVGSVGYMLQMSDHQDTVFAINASMAIGNVVLNLVLIRLYGAMGAALATGGIQVVGNLAQLIALYAFMGVQPFRVALWKPIAAAFIAGLIAWAVHGLAPPFHWLVGIPSLLLGYGGALLAFGLHPRDRSLALDVWNRAQNYVEW